MVTLSFPIVCVAPLSEEIMNRFLKESGIADNEDFPFAFIDSIDDYYDGPLEAPVDAPTNPDSPFINKTPEECSQLLLKLCEDTESEIIPSYFIIMDERSTQDDTVLLVSAESDYPVETVRATFEVSADEVILYLTGHSSAGEDAERALREPDNVFRGRASIPSNQNGSSLVSLLTQQDGYPRVSKLIFDYLDIIDIVALTRVSKSLSTLYVDSIKSHWDIIARLARFVAEPTEFRSVLGANEGLIIGSVAFQFFSRSQWDDSTLDIFVENGQKENAVRTYFLNEGYLSQQTKIIDSAVYGFEMTPWVKDGNTKINFITADLMPIWAFFEGPAFSTANSCFITWDAAYCLFPEYTFITRKIKLAHGLGTTYNSVVPILRRYIDKGCCLDHNSLEQGPDIHQECKETIKHLEGPRRIGDKKTWMIPLDCADTLHIDIDSTVIQRNTFCVSVERGEDNPGFFIKLKTLMFQCCILQHRYTFDVTEYPEDDFHEYLRYVLCRRAALRIQRHIDDGTFTFKKFNYRQALNKMSTATETKMGGKGCNEYCHLLESRRSEGGLIKPENWQHVDHLIPEIYAEWLKYQYDHGVVKTEIKEENDEDEA